MLCLSRALGGSSALTAALLGKLRAGAKVAIEDEVARLIQSVKKVAAAASQGEGSTESEAAENAAQQLMKHPALQAVAFLSVHERRLAVFEVWLDRWQVLSQECHCTCGSAEAADDGLTRIAAEAAAGKASGGGDETKAAMEELSLQVARLRDEARRAHQLEDFVVSEAQRMTAIFLAKQQQLLCATERLRALDKVRSDPAFALMQRAQKQLTVAAPRPITPLHKEPLTFIAEKCSKLASLARLMQHQQLHPQPPGGSRIRPSWERAHALTTGSAGEETDQGLLKALLGLQTPQASQHSRLSQGSGISYLASPTKKVAQVAAHKLRHFTAGDVDQADVAQGEGHNGNGRENRSSFFQGAGNNDTGEAEALSASSLAGRVSAEGQRSKRKHGVEEQEISCASARVRHAGIADADLDIDVEAASPPTGRNSTTDPAREARWIDSFLRRHPEI